MTNRAGNPESTPANAIPPQCPYQTNDFPRKNYYSPDGAHRLEVFDAGNLFSKVEFRRIVRNRDQHAVLQRTLCGACSKLGNGCSPEFLLPDLEANGCDPTILVMPQKAAPEDYGNFFYIDPSAEDELLEPGDRHPDYNQFPNPIPAECCFVARGTKPYLASPIQAEGSQFPKIIYPTPLKFPAAKIEQMRDGEADIPMESFLLNIVGDTVCGGCEQRNLEDCKPCFRFIADSEAQNGVYQVYIEPVAVRGKLAPLGLCRPQSLTENSMS